MGLIRVLFELFILYLVYKLIFDFIIPVYKTTKQVKQKVGEMQSRMDEHVKQQQANPHANASKNSASTSKQSREDYIEFEEVK